MMAYQNIKSKDGGMDSVITCAFLPDQANRQRFETTLDEITLNLEKICVHQLQVLKDSDYQLTSASVM